MQHLTIFYHFLEFRLRFFYLFISFNITFLLCYLNSLELIYLFIQPFSNYQKNFIFTDLTEAFYTTIKICLILSLFFLIPLIIYQIWCFFIPSFFLFERKKINLYFYFSISLLFFSSLIIYFFIIPQICHFFFTFEIKSTVINLELTARIQSYVNLTFQFFLFFICLFQIPTIFYIIYHYKLITSWYLLKNRKYFLFFSIFLAAFLSPPDLWSQFFLAIFFLFFFEFLIWFSIFLDNTKN